MRIVIQRVIRASVTINGQLYSEIPKGLLLLVGIGEDDTRDDIDYLIKKTVNLRVFDDEAGVMNLSIADINGEVMAVSQFTLMASTRKGNRPSYIRAARHEVSIPLYNQFVEALASALGKPIATGVFGADMKVELLNDGPVTVIIDSKNKDF
ncbi:MAG: D-tyrosyl-tRNA(Tyr) deacylase [Prevotella sp.]|nr:D-tyrosyl-tRNA(Tyr) deacylase [Prevotella sp.]